MQKNDTFYVSKVLKGDNNFLRRQVTSAMQARQSRQPLASQATQGDKQRVLKMSGSKQLLKSGGELNDFLQQSNSRQPTTNLDQSRHVNNHEST